MKSKKAQMKLSFGMIFSIILIIVFLAFGFFAIQKFLSFQKEVQITKFYTSFGEDIDGAWKSTRASSEVAYSLPSSVKKVCFSNDNVYENVYLYEKRPLAGKYFEHLKVERSFCSDVSDGKASFVLEKDYVNYGDNFVRATEK